MAARMPRAGIARKTVMIVDDEPELAELVADEVRAFGYRTVVATGPNAALALAAQIAVDVLVTDERMPGMTGRRLVGALATARGHDVPAILISGHFDSTPVVDERLVAVLPKPIDFDELRAALARAAAGAEPTS
jgi:CheY-like chemotaxis protein